VQKIKKEGKKKENLSILNKLKEEIRQIINKPKMSATPCSQAA
jgi:hypothetical protein